jgi:ribosomal protein S18 acetylase RimI-like enzyme
MPNAGAVIRRAHLDDAPACAAIAHDAYEPYLARMSTPPAPMLADYDAAIRDHEVWVAVDDADAVCGFVVLIPGGDRLVLDNVAVRPDAQGRGIGGSLLALAERRAADLGASEVVLYTNAVMTENQQLYTAHGYTETHRATDDGYERVFFAKPIRPNRA